MTLNVGRNCNPTAPPEEHLWTYRMKQGLGRASKNEWRNVLEVGPLYFDMIDMLREWRFGFHDYYDVFIWDFVPCQSSLDMYNVVITVRVLPNHGIFVADRPP